METFRAEAIGVASKARAVEGSLRKLDKIMCQIEIDDPSGMRVTVAIALLRAAIDDARSIAMLCQARGGDLVGSALSLLRPMHEKFKRGTWIAFCATDSQVQDFCVREKIPGADRLTNDIEKVPPFDTQPIFSAVFKNRFVRFNSYTHGGRWLLGFYRQPDGGIGAAFPAKQILQTLVDVKTEAVTAVQVMCMMQSKWDLALAEKLKSELEYAFLSDMD